MSEPPKCSNCRYFEDFSDPDDDPDEVNGYCGYDFATTGLSVNEYGGHWTHSDSVCDKHGGEMTTCKHCSRQVDTVRRADGELIFRRHTRQFGGWVERIRLGFTGQIFDPPCEGSYQPVDDMPTRVLRSITEHLKSRRKGTR